MDCERTNWCQTVNGLGESDLFLSAKSIESQSLIENAHLAFPAWGWAVHWESRLPV